MRLLHRLVPVLACVMLGVLAELAPAHEGHDHDTAAKPGPVTALPRAEATSEAFELVAVATPGELTIFLDRFATNEPVTDASLVVETPQGSVEAKPAGDGTYRLASPWALAPGRYDLIATVTTAGDADVLAFSLEIPPGNQDSTVLTGLFSTAKARGTRDRLSTDDSKAISALLIAFVAGGLVGLVLVRRRRAACVAVMLTLSVIAAHGDEGERHATPQAQPAASSAGNRDVAHILPDGGVFVPKGTQRILAIRTIMTQPTVYRRTVELPGRIIPDPNASGFVQTVVGGRLSPPERGFPRLGAKVKKGDVLAYVTQPLQAIDVSDMRQRQGELDQQISIVERRLARFETLGTSGSVARAQIDDTRLELQGLRDRRAALDSVKREPEPLVAPVDGVIADGTPVAGQVVQTNAVIFHIIDPEKLWVEALSYQSLPPLQGATAQLGDRRLKLEFRGAGFADRNQSVPIHFAAEGDIGNGRVGQFVTVFAETPEEQTGLAVPRTSIVRTSSGQDSVFEHVAAERFEQRPVRIDPLDGQRVLISQGLQPGRRVVVQGAELIDHIR